MRAQSMRFRSVLRSGIVRFIRHATQSTAVALAGSSQLQTLCFTPFWQRFIVLSGFTRCIAPRCGSYPTSLLHFKQRELPKKSTLPHSQVNRCMKSVSSTRIVHLSCNVHTDARPFRGARPSFAFGFMAVMLLRKVIVTWSPSNTQVTVSLCGVS